jgi:hypothetical protein
MYEPRILTGGTVEVIQDNSQILSLSSQLENERRMRMDLQAQMNEVLRELAICKQRLDRLDPPESALHSAVKRVERRGNLRLNHQTGHVTLLAPLAFHPRTTKDEPTAVLRDPEIADAICRDLAELSQIFNCPMTIEGHTKGGQNDFWQTLADRRAMLIADKMVEFGANPNVLETRGLPGRLGKNEVRTEVYMDITNIKDEQLEIIQQPVLTGTTTILQASPAQVVERDIIMPDGHVERQFYGSRTLPISPVTTVRPGLMM